MRDQITSLIESPNARDQIAFCACHSFLGGVYMRKLHRREFHTDITF